MTPSTIAAAPMPRRVACPSASTRAPRNAPMRIPISRAGATYETGLAISAVSTRMYARRLRIPTASAAPASPRLAQLVAAAQGEWREEHRLSGDRRPVVKERRDQQGRDRGLIPERV